MIYSMIYWYFPTRSVWLQILLHLYIHISPVVELTYYYAYLYHDGLRADADIKYSTFQNIHIHGA